MIFINNYSMSAVVNFTIEGDIEGDRNDVANCAFISGVSSYFYRDQSRHPVGVFYRSPCSTAENDKLICPNK